MNRRVTILDCDFGAGEIEASVLGDLGYELSLADPATAGEPVNYNSVALLTQYHPITDALLDANPTVRAVVRYGVGLDVIDLDACARRGVRVSGIVDYCTDEVADHTFALLLAAVRGVAHADKLVKEGKWPTPREFPLIRRLRGSTLGLLGMGRIAAAVAERAKAFGLQVVVHDKFVSDEDILKRGCTPATFDEVMRQDFISLHLPLNADTAKIINWDALSHCGPDTILINASRGGLVDNDALLQALDSGQLGWVGLDVVDPEGPDNAICRHPKVTVTPHIAYFSPESLEDLRMMAARRAVELSESA
jgi:D-3-phosphoglycerate dehydrogenase